MNKFYNKSKIRQYCQKLLFNGLTGLAYFIIKNISRSLRFKIVNADYVIEEKKKGGNYIFAFWHNQFFAMPYFYCLKLGEFSISVLTSLSRDGEYISRVIEKFGFNAIRGSSSRKGNTAIRLLIRQLQGGSDVAVTPDGPRGPRHEVQPGIITLAQLSECPVIPVGYQVNRKKALNTWDKFIIPLPFSSGKFIIGNPILVPREATDTQKEEYRKELQKSLLSISEP